MTSEQRIIDNPVESEMRDSFLEYSLSVIMARALPDVRDGLKPVHRRILYGMSELGIRPSTPYKKSARVTGDVMGKYHPHGDSALYEALVRLAQPWSLRAPLIDGHGNFGSLDDGPAAARYCVVGETMVRLADGTDVRIDELTATEPNSTVDIDIEVLGAHGEAVHASKFHHSGNHPTLRVTAREGFEVTGTGNHPIVVLEPAPDGIAGASWRLLEDVRPGDLVALSRHTITDRSLTVASDDYYFATVATIVDAGVQPVFSLRVDTDEHAFITNGFISHNTECRLDQMGASLLEGLNEGTVDFLPNYDGTETEPDVLPAAFPNLLVNGSQGIAVGMATNMAPHNLVEVVAGLRAMLAAPDISLTEMMGHIPGPDLPTGGSIWGLDGVRDAYETGRGSFKMRATAEIGDVSSRRKGIIISELPYLVGPERVIAKVKELVNAKRLNGISDIRDHSDRKNGLQVVVECKTGFNPAAVLDELYRLTPLEESFGINNVALVGGEPRTLGLLDLCRLYLEHRRDVIRRRTQHRLDKAQARLHIIEGLLVALDAIDEVVATIRASKTTETARKNLRSKLKLSDIQAQHILDMPLRRLTSLEVTKLRDEQKEVKAMIADLSRILSDASALDGLVGDELQLVADTFGDARRTSLMDEAPVAGAVAAALEVPDEPCWVTLTTTGLIGRGAAVAQKSKPTKADVLVDALETTTRSTVAVITDRGRVLRVNTVELPVIEAKNKGGRVDEFVALESGEAAVAVVPYNPDDAASRTLFLVTAGGVAKRAGLDTLVARTDGFTVIALDDGDRLVGAFEVADSDDVVVVTSAARLLRTPVGKIRPQGRTARGVAGMRLDDDGVVIAAGRVTDTAVVAVVTDTGAVKVTPAVDYPSKGRGGGGVRCCTFRKADTSLVASTVAEPDALVPTAGGNPVTVGDWIGKRDGSGVATEPVVDGFGTRRP